MMPNARDAAGIRCLYVLEHKRCGHFAGAGTLRAGMEAQLQMLTASGYYQWRVRRVDGVEVETVAAAILSDERCSRCTIDTSRAHLPGVAAAARAASELGPRIVIVPEPDDPDVAIMPAACLAADVDDMRRQSHDGLLEQVRDSGQTPTGRVEWREWQGRDVCRSVMHTRPIKAFGIDQFDAFFDEYPADCVLIVASVPVLGRVGT